MVFPLWDTGWLFILLYPTVRFLAVLRLLLGWGRMGGCGLPSAGMGYRKLPQKKRLSGVFGSVGGTEEGRLVQTLMFECWD